MTQLLNISRIRINRTNDIILDKFYRLDNYFNCLIQI